MISEEVVSKIKEENDIVDIISEDINLKRAGANYSGKCPFHNEKTASFVVSPQKQFYKCFGCNESGNVITYIMKTKRLTFPEACSYLAEKANIELNEDKGNYDKEYVNKRKKYFNINVEVARYFFNNLRSDKSSLDYFYKRGIEQKTINKFGLGYAQEGWNNLMKYLKAKGYSELDMLNLGLIIKSEKGNYYDRFRNRVMFPVFNVQGKVIGFGGRVLDDSKPKYLNSPETVLFHKGTNLYGLNFAIKNLNVRKIIVVEGYMDCIALSQHGITNVVASLGTAFTPKQAKLLKRYVDEIVMAFDSDDAGVAATTRGIDILKDEGFNVKILSIPNGKDPDEFIKKFGKKAFEELIDNAQNLIDYKLQSIEKGYDLKDTAQKAEFVKKSVEILGELNPAEKDIYIKNISEKTGVLEQSFYDMLKDKIKEHKKTYNVNENGNYSQKLYLEPAYLKAEKSLLNFMMNPHKYNRITSIIVEDDLVLDSHKEIYKIIVNAFESGRDNVVDYVESRCQDIKTIQEFINIKNVEYSNIEDIDSFIDNCYFELKKYKLEESKRKIMRSIKEKESKGLIEECLNLASELRVIESELTQLNRGERR